MKKLVDKMVLFLSVMVFLFACSSRENNDTKEKPITVTTSLQGKETIVGNIKCNFPINSKVSSLNILSSGYDNIDLEDVYVWKKYEKMTGLKVNWTKVTKENRDEKIHTSLTNKKPLDLILRCRIESNVLSQYGKNGLLIDLAKNDLLKNNAPNCWNYLQNHPEALASVTNPDGSIYALPQINSGAELRVSRKIFINKNWLAKVKKKVPKTLDEFTKLLKAFKQQDANGNGDPNDEIPLCCFDWDGASDVMYGAFGIVNRGIHNTFVDYDDSAKKVRLVATANGYKDFMEYYHNLYKEGLLDKNLFTITMDQWTNNAANDRIGVMACTNLAVVPSGTSDDWVAIEEALKGPNGDKMCSAVRANFHSTGAAALPTTCADPEAALRWLDYFWTDEGTLFYHMGIENETFVAKKDGTYDYTPAIYDEIKRKEKSFDDIVASYSPYPGGGNPTVEIAPYFMGGEMAPIPSAAARKLFQYGPKEYWPSFTFTAEETEILNRYQTDISKYITDSRVDFIIGKKSLDSWDDYVKQIDKLGKDKVLAVYEAALKRYKELVSSTK